MGLKKGVNVKPAKGKLGILLPGMGAVATTFIAGCLAVRRDLAKPIGSMTEMGTIRLGKRTENRVPKIRDYVSLPGLDDLVFGGWDIFSENCYDAASRAGVLEDKLLDQIKDELSAIAPMSAVFEQAWVKKLTGEHVKKGDSKMHLAEQLMDDIKSFKEKNECDRIVVVWCGSTEVYRQPTEVHSTLAKFEEGLRNNDENIAPSQIYAYAAVKMGIPYANGAPNLSVDRDGEVLDDPESFKTKEVSKLGVLEHILQPRLYPDLYKDIYHKVRINYYPPRGDNKEGWDNIDIFGWLGYPMQIKVDFLCRDSILAAPIVLDLALFMDLAKRADMHGIQEWLSFYFKSPMTPKGCTRSTICSSS